MAWTNQTKLNNELSHHGVLGMKWYVRRYQKYPAGYSGEGRYVGPDGSPRKPTFKERRQMKKFNKLQDTITRAAVDAVANGDKRMLKAMRPVMDESTYASKMRELTQNGARINALNGDVRGVKSFKNDISKQEYKYYKNLSKFVNASNNLDPKVMQKRMKKISDADLAALNDKIGMVPGMNRKINDMKRERNSIPTKADNIANVIKEGTKIVVASGAAIAATYAVMNNLDNIAKLIDNRTIRKGAKLANSIIKKDDIALFEKSRSKLTAEQMDTVAKSLYNMHRSEIAKAAADKDLKTLDKFVSVISKKEWDELDKASKFLGGISVLSGGKDDDDDKDD